MRACIEIPVGKRYTKEEISQIQALSQEGYTIREIAEILGMSEAGIRNIRHRKKIKTKITSVNGNPKTG